MTNEAPLPQNIDAILVYLKTRLSLGTCRLLGSPIDKIRAHIAALEADNRLLREVLRTCEGRIINAQIGINTGDTKA